MSFLAILAPPQLCPWHCQLRHQACRRAPWTLWGCSVQSWNPHYIVFCIDRAFHPCRSPTRACKTLLREALPQRRQAEVMEPASHPGAPLQSLSPQILELHCHTQPRSRSWATLWNYETNMRNPKPPHHAKRYTKPKPSSRLLQIKDIPEHLPHAAIHSSRICFRDASQAWFPGLWVIDVDDPDCNGHAWAPEIKHSPIWCCHCPN